MQQLLLGITSVWLHPRCNRTIGVIADRGDELGLPMSILWVKLTDAGKDHEPPPPLTGIQALPENLEKEIIDSVFVFVVYRNIMLDPGGGYSHMCGIRGCAAQTGHFFSKKP